MKTTRKPRDWSSSVDVFMFKVHRDYASVAYSIGQLFFWHTCAGHCTAAREIGKRLIQWADWAEARAKK